jgi:hypothetical protein
MTHQTVHLPAEDVPVLAEADVVVAGGGTSGFIAATAAARSGARTLLVERFGYLGGCTTTTYNTSLGHFTDIEGRRIIGGLGYEFIERMHAEGEAFGIERTAPQIWPPTTKKVALDMVEGAGARILFYTWVGGVLQENGNLKGLIVQTKAGRGVILGKAFVDATGDADLAAAAGCPFEMTAVDDLQQVSVDYLACGVDAARVVTWARENREHLVGIGGLEHEHQMSGAQPMFSFTIPNQETGDAVDGHYRHVGVMPTVKLLVYREAVRIQGNVEIDPLDPWALSYAESAGLRGALSHLRYLKETVPGFEGAFVAAQNHLGVRESRRIVGEYMITLADLESQVRFPDVVALNCRGLDYHLKGTLFKFKMLPGSHDIPLRALLPRGVDNLLVVGRSISCDHDAQASLRGAATCLATGHAAGTAAALAARSGGVRRVDIAELQKKLTEQGAILSLEK